MSFRIVVAGVVVAFAFSGLFVTAFHDPSPHAIPVGVVAAGDDPAGAAPGLDVRRYRDAASARADVADGEIRAALVPGPRVLVAGAGGAVEAQVAAAALAPGVATVDVVPLPGHDSRGLSPVFTALSVAVAGVVFGVLLTLLGAAAPLPARLLAIAAFGGATGLVVALTVDPLINALTGAFWAVAVVAALGAAAVGAATHALGRLAGPPGLAIAALIFVPLAQSASGGALGPDLVPGFFGALHEALPTGAALTALRDAVYFDGAGTAGPLLVLAAWAAAGAGLTIAIDQARS